MRFEVLRGRKGNKENAEELPVLKHAFSVSRICIRTDAATYSDCQLVFHEPAVYLVAELAMCQALTQQPPSFFNQAICT